MSLITRKALSVILVVVGGVFLHGIMVYGIKQSKQGFLLYKACVYSNLIHQKHSSRFHH